MEQALATVLVAGDDAAGGLGVVEVLALLVAIAGVGVHALDAQHGHARLHAQPDRRTENKDVRRHYPILDAGPFIGGADGVGLGILDHAEGDVVLQQMHEVDGHPLRVHDPGGTGHQPAGVRGSWVVLDGAVEKDGFEIAEVVCHGAPSGRTGDPARRGARSE